MRTIYTSKSLLLLLTIVCFSLTHVMAQTQDAWTILDRANVYYQNGAFAKAIPLYRKAETRGIEANIIAFNIGNCLYRLGKLPEAAASYRRSIRSGGGSSDGALLNLASVLFTLGEYPESIALYRRYLKNDPEALDAWLYLSDAYLRTKDWVGAQKALEKAYALDTTQVGVIYQLSEIFVKQKDYDRAIVLVEKASRENPNEIDFMFYLGDLHRDALKYDEAANWYRRGLSVQPNKTEVLYKLADVLDRGQKPFLAMDVLQKALVIDTSFSDAAIFLGNLAFDRKWWDRAEAAYTKALKLGNAEGWEGIRNLVYERVENNDIRSAKLLIQRIHPIVNKYPLMVKEIAEWESGWKASEESKPL